MIWWVGFMVILTVLSYLNDTGVISFLHDMRIPFLDASLLSFLILVGTAGILIRMLMKKRQGEKELLKERVRRLERELSKNRF